MAVLLGALFRQFQFGGNTEVSNDVQNDVTKLDFSRVLSGMDYVEALALAMCIAFAQAFCHVPHHRLNR
jgi:hypothetical protein